MSELKRLMDTLCPDGVEYKELREIAEYSKNRVSMTELNAGNYVGVDNLLPNEGGKKDAVYIPEEGRAIQFVEGDILIGNIRPYLRKIWLAEYAGGTNGDVLPIHITRPDKILPKYLYYILSSHDFWYYDVQHSKGAKMPRGSKSEVMKYRFPVPPLAVQSEIVRLLDNFTALTAALTAELAARKTQYEHYRDALLTFPAPADDTALASKQASKQASRLSDVVRWLPLGKICTRQKGISITARMMRDMDSPEGTVKIFAGGNTIAYIEAKNIPAQSVIDKPSIIVKSRGNIGFEYYDRPFSHKNEMWSYSIKSNDVLLKFIYYYLKKNTDYFQRKAKSGKLPQISISDTDNFAIPVPLLVEQERIVAILDKFDALVNDISRGLPAEIEARKKQYAYYRDRLLDFREKRA